MSAARRTKRIPVVRSAPIAAGGAVDVILERGVCAFTIAVVDAATFAGVAWTLAYESDPDTRRHFAAGEVYSEDLVKLGPAPLTVRLGAAVAARAELIVWRP